MKKIILLLSIIISCTSFLSAQSSWVKISNSNIGEISNIVIIGSDIFISGFDQVYLSTDNGVTWVLVSGFPTVGSISSLATDGHNLFVAGTRMYSTGAFVYKSSDLGVTWTDISPMSSFGNDKAETLLIDQDTIYVGAFFSGIYKSVITGISTNTWTTFNNGLSSNTPPYIIPIYALNILGSTIIAGTYGMGAWISPVILDSWLPTAGMIDGANYIGSLCSYDSIVLAANISGTPVLYRSLDSGHTWNPVNSSVFLDMPINTLINNADTIYAGSSNNGVLISLDGGINWVEYNDGLKDLSGNWVGNTNQKIVNAFLIAGSKIYAATGDGVWSRSFSVVLPVTLVNFDAAYKNGSAYLTWKTATESNLKKFEIERSFEGSNFKKLGEVNAIGNSSLTHLYSYVDNSINNYSGNIFFRLKQIDFDGKFSYSTVTSIKIKHGLQQIQVYPNPATQQLTLQISPVQLGLKYHISNAAGQQVLSGKLSGLKTNIDIRKIESGTYFLQIEDKGKETIKFLKE
ncbi:MAG: T9SS type A sorting domain-containing protein [Ginsengibacter sp.]